MRSRSTSALGSYIRCVVLALFATHSYCNLHYKSVSSLPGIIAIRSFETARKLLADMVTGKHFRPCNRVPHNIPRRGSTRTLSQDVTHAAWHGQPHPAVRRDH